MLEYLCKSPLSSSTPSRKRSVRPVLEGLEDRLLLYSAYGGHFVFGSRITYSLMPDGTSVGGTPSVLFQTLNAKYPTATWQQQFQKAAAVWEAVANINLAQVSDNGSPLGVNGNQQDDPRFGDIRFSAIPQSSGTLATCFLPPPINGGTDAGDIVFNSSVTWQINSSYDLETVAIHEIGHALGMGHSAIQSACMYAIYNGTKQSLTSDDISGIQSIWQAPQPDRFNSNGQNNGTTAVNITSYIDGNGQIAIPSLAINNFGQTEYFSVTAPSTTAGRMVVTMQSSNLSSLSPQVMVADQSLNLLGQASSSNFGDSVSVTVTGVQPRQSFYISASASTSDGPIGSFGLEVNFGSRSQPPIPPPNTVVLQQPDQGGGSMNLSSGSNSFHQIRLGHFSGWGEKLTIEDLGRGGHSPFFTQITVNPESCSNLDLGVIGVLGNLPGQQDQPTVFSQEESTGPVTVSVTPTFDASVMRPIANQALDSVLASWSPKSLLSLLEPRDA